MLEKMPRNSRDISGFAALAEPLESRRLLAGIEAGVLVARGTGGPDTIGVRRRGTDNVVITTNGVNQTFDMDDFTGVRLEGLGGNDVFNLVDPLVSPVVRNTTVLGGAGNDTISYATRTAALSFGIDPGGSSMTSGAQTDVLDHVETVIGGGGADSFAYGDSREVPPEEEDVTFDFRLEGRGGNDRFISQLTRGHVGEVSLFGGDGDDHFEQGDQGGLVFGEGGNDTILVRSREANYAGSVDGGAGTDVIIGAGGNRDVLDLREYANVENAVLGSFRGTVFGTEGPNHIDGSGSDAVTIIGLGGNDTLIGGDENDSLVGGFGNDTVDGGAGTDTADGGPGDDTVLNAEIQPAPGTIGIVNRVLIADGSWGQDLITIERTGIDNVIVRVDTQARGFDMDAFDGVLLRGNGGYDDLRVLDPIVAGSLVRKVTLLGGGGNDSLRGSAGDEVIRGGAGNDRMFGKGGGDALFGDAGNDYLVGGGATDFLDGSDGHDYLDANDGGGGDSVLGGDGFDTAEVDPGDSASNVEAFA